MHFILADAIHASLFISPESHSGKSLYNTIIFQLSPQTFVHLTKNYYLCTRNPIYRFTDIIIKSVY